MGCCHNQCRNKIFLRYISKSYWKSKAIVSTHKLAVTLKYLSKVYIYNRYPNYIKNSMLENQNSISISFILSMKLRIQNTIAKIPWA